MCRPGPIHHTGYVGKSQSKDAIVLTKDVSATPPWHTLVVLAVLLATFVSMIPSLESIDEIANKETFLRVCFPEVLSIQHVAAIRLFLAFVMFADISYSFFFGKWEVDTTPDFYFPQSKLTGVRGMSFRGVYYTGKLGSGIRNLGSFTMCSFVTECVTFALAGGIPLYIELSGSEPPLWIYRIAIVAWETCAPISLLVSAIVKYVLWPLALQQGGNNTKLLKAPGALLEHNLNIISCLLEVTILGGLPIRYQDCVWAPLFGLAYVLFTYRMIHSWAGPKHGPQFIYPFLDTTMGWVTTACILGLLAVLGGSFVLFAGLKHFIVHVLQGGFWAHVGAVILLCAGLCRFRD